MSRQDDLLRQACAQLAQEETDQLEKQLTNADMQEAEALFARHRRKALGIIAQHTGTASSRRAAALRIAACLLLIAGGLYLGLRKSAPPPDLTPLASAPSPSVAPYYSQMPKDAPGETAFPTETPALAPTEATVPSPVPKEAEKPIITTDPGNASDDLSISPTESPISSETPSHFPTETAKPFMAPDLWTGQYFPQSLPESYVLSLLTQENGVHIAAYTREDRELVFTEYDTARSITTPGQAQRDYVQLTDGAIALRLTSDEGVLLAWDIEGRTLTLFGEEADVLAIADSVAHLP